MTTSVAVPEVRSIATIHEFGVDDVVAQVTKIQRVMEATMKAGEHYGVIPGTEKPTLLKPGAEKLCLTFRLDPQYEVTSTMDGGHLTVLSRCTLYHIPTGMRLGSGMGSCSTKETKYAYRQAKRVCPACGLDAIIKGKVEYGGGWLCHKKQGGCGAKYGDTDVAITGQPVGRVVNPDLPDQYNTVLKMANKRSLVASVLNVTAASDIFTQDLEDYDLPGAKGVVPSVEPVQTTPPTLPEELLPQSNAPEEWEIIANDFAARLDESTTKAEGNGWLERWAKKKKDVPPAGHKIVDDAIARARKRFA